MPMFIQFCGVYFMYEFSIRLLKYYIVILLYTNPLLLISGHGDMDHNWLNTYQLKFENFLLQLSV